MNSNFDFWWNEFKLGADSLLWLMHHEKRYTVDDLKTDPNWDQYKHIFLVDQEIESHELSDRRIHLWNPAVSTADNHHTYLAWFDYVNQIEDKTHYTQRLRSDKNPTHHFDALLGTPRVHKDYILEQITSNNLESKFILGCLGSNNNRVKTNNNWIPGGEFDQGTLFPQVPGHDIMWELLSCILPYDIYNDSWYSVICETTPSRPAIFTEKTAKPLLAKRVFVLVGAQYHLRDLRSLGYKTFDGIIDESYDKLSNDRDRWQGAWEQIIKLLTMDPVVVYNQAQDILEHNYQLFRNTNWMHKVKADINEILSVIPKD